MAKSQALRESKVFANWHFGNLGDDARVESKQSK